TITDILEDENYTCDSASNQKMGVAKLYEFLPDIVLLDVKLGTDNGLDVLKEIVEFDNTIQTIMISGNSGIKEAVKAIKLGAFDFMEKPLSLHKIKIAVKKAIEFKKMAIDYRNLKLHFSNAKKLIGDSEVMQKVRLLIAKVAPTNVKVLIRGESGTGKELIAYAIHNQSKRADKLFVKFNSAAIPTELVESELFGFEKGAFTGANRNKKGKIEEADNGTLFLDEIGDMNLDAQSKILRILQEGEFERVGSNKTLKIDVRIIAATHKNLEKMVEEGTFRKDLFYRLNVVPIVSPPLREHMDDFEKLLKYFSNIIAQDMGIGKKEFTESSLDKLKKSNFPGNVRELRNLVERIYILVDGNVVDENDFEMDKKLNESANDTFWIDTTKFKEKKIEFERRYLTVQFDKHKKSVSKTADALGFHQGNLSRKLKNLDISL
ncbi:MAG: sigma-54 dependent transcriptional regulator, partial [Candidatus Cloacimonadota bacterium]|nr:sigma-54 dependent transcriptional regulator [Candidatus Cloacimonadota bacterium]